MAKTFRIARLKLAPFLCHQDTLLNLEQGSIYNFVGPFGSGKSTIGHAVRWCLEGSSDRDPKPGKPRVELDAIVDGARISFHRTASSSSHGSKQDVFALLGIRESSRSAKDDISLLEVLTDPRRYAEVSTDTRLRFLDRALVDPLTEDDLASVKDPNVRHRALTNPKGALQFVMDRRKEDERTASAEGGRMPPDETVDLLGTECLLSSIDIAAMREKMAVKKRARDKAMTEVAMARALLSRDVKGELVAAERVLKEAREAERTADAARRAFATGEPAKKVHFLREQKRACEEVARDLTVKASEAEKSGSKCEKCGQSVPSEEARALRQNASENMALAKESQDGIDAHDREAAKVGAVWQAAHEAVLRAEKALAAIVPPEMPDESEIEKKEKSVATFDVKAQQVDILLGRAEAYQGAVRAAASIEESRHAALERAAMWDADEQALRRIIAERGSGALPALRGRVEGMGERVGEKVSVDDEGMPTIGGRGWRELSTGQRFVASVLVAAALSSLSGFGFLFVDEMGSVDWYARQRMMMLLRALTKGEKAFLQQVFVVSLSDSVRWCDGCGRQVVSNTKGCCTVCQGETRLKAPGGTWSGVYRMFESVGLGEFREVLDG